MKLLLLPSSLWFAVIFSKYYVSTTTAQVVNSNGLTLEEQTCIDDTEKLFNENPNLVIAEENYYQIAKSRIEDDCFVENENSTTKILREYGCSPHLGRDLDNETYAKECFEKAGGYMWSYDLRLHNCDNNFTNTDQEIDFLYICTASSCKEESIIGFQLLIPHSKNPNPNQLSLLEPFTSRNYSCDPSSNFIDIRPSTGGYNNVNFESGGSRRWFYYHNLVVMMSSLVIGMLMKTIRTKSSTVAFGQFHRISSTTNKKRMNRTQFPI